jgi:hypothetical protein
MSDYLLPPTFELPLGHLASRKQHLLAELASSTQRHHSARLWRPTTVVAISLLALAVVAAPTLALSQSEREFVGLSSSPPVARNWVHATLTSPVPIHAQAGTRIRLTWTLSAPDQPGRNQPFDATYIFARLLGSHGAAIQTARAHGSHGRYNATLTVPKGGIHRIQIGIMGWSDGPHGRHPAPNLFPISNNPLSHKP